jgi:hypothetical protein
MAAGAGVEDMSDRSLGWRLLYPFFKHRSFPRWKREDLAEPRRAEEACPVVTKLFISHRWATPGDPDPDHTDLPTVVEYLSRVFMLANGFISEESAAVKELVIGPGLRSAFHESQLERCDCKTPGWLDVKFLLPDGAMFYKKILDPQRRRNFYCLLKHVRVWYDYSSIPQERFTQNDEARIEHALSQLAHIVSQSEVLTLWGVESIKRGWCIFEALAADRAHVCAPASSKLGAMDRAILESLVGERPDSIEALHAQGRPGPSIMNTVDQFRRDVAGLGEREIHEYFEKNGIQCTKAADLALLANLVHQYLKTGQATTSPRSRGT